MDATEVQTKQKLDPEFKAKWVAALRSGKYVQGSKTLKEKVGDSFHYCCLGVAAEIIDPDAFSLDEGWETRHRWRNWSSAVLDDTTLTEIGLTDDQQWSLTILNDGTTGNPKLDVAPVPPLSFDGIADYIEENL